MAHDGISSQVELLKNPQVMSLVQSAIKMTHLGILETATWTLNSLIHGLNKSVATKDQIMHVWVLAWRIVK